MASILLVSGSTNYIEFNHQAHVLRAGNELERHAPDIGFGNILENHINLSHSASHKCCLNCQQSILF